MEMSKKDTSKKLNNLKMEAAAELGMSQFVKENNDHDMGDVAAKVNGSQGGPIGGRMVRKMIESEQGKMLD
jgi:hypothetical protein